MLLQPTSYSSPRYLPIFFLTLILAHASIVQALVFCSREIFGVPNYRHCAGALSAVPTDNVVQFFVEQQLRTGLPEANWATFVDPRPFGLQKPVVQVPKMWNNGNCNIALLSYAHGGTGMSVSPTQWRKIFAAGLQTLMTCLAAHHQGGAAVVNSILGTPALSVFVWQDGAEFERTMNNYMSAPFPAGIDPGNPAILQSRFSFLGNLTTAGIALTGNVSMS